jgi:Bacterial PH domain
MNRPWWSVAIQWALWFIVMSVVMGWLAKGRLRARLQAEGQQVKHPPSTLVLGLVGFAFFAGITILSNLYANPTTTIYATLTFAGFALLNLVLVADYVFARHEVSERGMHYGRMIGVRGTFEWHDVVRVRFAPSMKWFAITLADGRTVRVSAMMTGLPEFARLLLNGVNGAALDADTRALLDDTAAGHPPSIWR